MTVFATMDVPAGCGLVRSGVADSLGAAVAKVERVPGSVANQDYRVALADGRCVFVKVGPRSELAAEVWALGQAAAAGVPVPEVLGYQESPVGTRTPYLILESLTTDDQQASSVMRAAGQAMARAHTIQVPGYGPIVVVGSPANPESVAGEYATWQDFVGSILQDVDELAHVGLLTAQQWTRLHRAAESTGPSPLAGDSGVLLHADLKPQHVMAAAGTLNGLIDWGDASAGDPAWDLARASMMEAKTFGDLADGYPGADHDQVARLLPVYRLLWNARTLAHEYRAGGDWFAEYLQRIAEDLAAL